MTENGHAATQHRGINEIATLINNDLQAIPTQRGVTLTAKPGPGGTSIIILIQGISAMARASRIYKRTRQWPTSATEALTSACHRTANAYNDIKEKNGYTATRFHVVIRSGPTEPALTIPGRSAP